MIEDFNAFLKIKKFPSVLLLFGEEDFLLDEAYQSIIDELKKDVSFNFNFDAFDGSETDLHSVIDLCRSFPMMSDKRTVVINNCEKLFSGIPKKNQDNSSIAKYLNNPSESTFLIFKTTDSSLYGISSSKKQKSETKKSIKFPFNILIQEHEWCEFPKVYESDFSNWAAKRLKKLGKEISPDALEFLIAQCPPSLRDLNNEIVKLNIFAGDVKNISLTDVSSLVGHSRVNNVFELQKAVGQKQLGKSFDILQNMLAADSQEILIITMLIRYFVILWKLFEEFQKESNNYKLAGLVGISPFFVPEYITAMKKYSSSELENAFLALCDADLKLKSTSTDALVIMQNLILRIIEGN